MEHGCSRGGSSATISKEQWMVGPVLYLEMMLGGRRGRLMTFRYIYVGWLVLQFSSLYLLYLMNYAQQEYKRNLTSQFATGFVEMFVVQQLIITLLVTPAFCAGAITDEKTRGTLQYLLTAHVTAGEIIIGKLLARMAQVGLLILAGLPVLCFVGVFGGLHPGMMLAVFAVTAVPVFALGAASLLASVWCRETRDAVLSLYAVGLLLLLLAWIAHRLAASLTATLSVGSSPGLFLSLLIGVNDLTALFNPLYVLEPGWESGNMVQVMRRLFGSMMAWGCLGAACMGLAVWRLRASYLHQLEHSGKKKSDGNEAGRRAPVGDEPIRWKEREIDGIAPMAPFRKIPFALGVVLVFFLTVVSSLGILWASMAAGVTFSQVYNQLTRFDLLGVWKLIDPREAGPLFLIQSIAAMLIASLIVGIRASGAVSGERERQTWEALLLTPLEAKQLIRGKLWGIFGAALRCLAAYAIPALVLSFLGGFQAFFWTLLWLAVTLLAMWYIGAGGIFASVRSRSSWRALLGTLGFGYVGGFILYVCASPIILIVAAILYIFLKLADDLYNLGLTATIGPFKDFFFAFFFASCLALAAIFYGFAWWFITDAEKRVSDRERTRHWKDEPLYRPRRRATLAQARYYQ
jgi:ABC-type transport system involved in multi-copper enzyme maturation permease subunit